MSNFDSTDEKDCGTDPPTADLECPNCGDAIQQTHQTPGTGLVHVAPCGCQVAPELFRDLEIARDPDTGNVAFWEPKKPTAWIESDTQVLLEDRT